MTMRADTPALARRVRRAQAGDRQALTELVGDHLDMLYNVTGRALDGHADVDDVVQNVLVSVVEKLPSVREPERFSGWVLAIARREIADQLRRRQLVRQRSRPLDEVFERPDPASDFTELTILRLGLTGQRRQVVEAARWLDEDARFVLSLWWLELLGEISRADLATALGLEPGHAAVRVKRMREQLELSRTIVGVLADRGCGDLTTVLDGWDGIPSPVWRKRLGRHLRDCRVCTPSLLVAPEQLLSGLVMLPATLSLPAALKGAGAGVASLMGPAGASGAGGAGAAGTAGAGGAGGWLVGKVAVGVVAAVVVAGGAVVVADRPESGRNPTVPAVTEVAQTSSSTMETTTEPEPSATVTTPKATKTTMKSLYGSVIDTVDAAPAADRKPDPLPVRPEGTLEVADSGDNDPRAEVVSLIHRGEWVTFRGQGYVRVDWAMAITERVGTVTMPSWTGLDGKLFHVASGGGYRLDDQKPDQADGYTWMGDAEHGQAVLPGKTQQMWAWEYYYVDGEVTFTSNERGADYNLYVHIVDRKTVNADLRTAPGDDRVRYGLNRDTGNDSAPVPQYVTRKTPDDPATVPRRSQVD